MPVASARDRDAPGCEFHVFDANEPLPFEDGSFDAVFSNDSVHHLRNRRATLRESVFRVSFDRDGMLELHCTKHDLVRDQEGGWRAGEHVKFQHGSGEPRRAGDARFNHVLAKPV